MLDFEILKPEKLMFGDNISLFFTKIKRVQDALNKRKTYIRMKKEYEELMDELLWEVKENRLKKIEKRLIFLEKYIEKQEQNICKQIKEFFILEIIFAKNSLPEEERKTFFIT